MIQNISKGTGFKGATSYVFKKDAIRLNCGTMAGETIKELSKEASVFRKMRPQLNKACFHVSVGLPPGEALGDEKWEEFATEYMSRMGFKNAPWLAVKHDDTDHKHIHIVALRIDSEGKSITDSRDYERGALILQDFEQRWGLTPSAMTPQQAYEKGERGISFAEMGKYKRTGEVPEKLKIKEIVSSALTGNPTIADFAERLDMAGVSMLPNISPKSGHVAGISFAMGGVAVKGSGLGKNFSWAGLQKQGLVWDKTEDKELLVSIKEANANEHNDAVKITGKKTDNDGKTSSSTAPTASISKPGNDQPGGSPDSEIIGGFRAPSTVSGVLGGERGESNKASRKSGMEGQADSKRDESRLRGGGGGAESRTEGNKEIKRPISTAIKNERPSFISNNNSIFSSDGDNAWSRIVLLSAESLFSMDGGEFRPQRCCGISTTSLGAVEQHLKQKIKAFREQHKALEAPKYRITLVNVNKNKPGFNLGKKKEKKERFFTADEVEKQLPFLSKKNSEGYNVYITPISDKEHYCVLDDSTPEKIAELYKKTGIEPCLTQESSPGNYQAIYRVQGPSGDIQEPSERSIGNAIVQAINKKYGDQKFSGVTHPFRLAGFANRKPKYSKDGKYPFVKIKHCKPGIDPQMSKWFKNARLENEKRKQEQEYIKEQERIEQKKQKRYEKIRINANDHGNIIGDLDKVYARNFQAVEKVRKEAGWKENLSVFDWRIAKQMLYDNYNKQQIAQAIFNNSPALSDRHPNSDDYINRTIEKASAEVENEKQQRRAAKGGPDRRM